MKIVKNFEFNGKIYNALSDNSNELDSKTLFVLTKRNTAFLNNNMDFIKAENLKEIFKIPKNIIGITGTNGKTTTAAIIYSLLLDSNKTCALLGTRGAFKNDKQILEKGLTTPGVLALYAFLESVNDCEFVVMEVSSHAIEQERIAGLEFRAKVLTNITSDHLDYHKTIDEYIRVKNSFFIDSGLKIINADESKAIFNKENAFTYGIENKADLKVNAYSLDSSLNAHLSFFNKAESKKEDSLLNMQLFGKHNLYNALAALLCVKVILDSSLEGLCQIAENFGGVQGRMEVISENPLIIVDFAHTEDGLKVIFESFKDREISVVFGAGGDRDTTKRAKMGRIAATFAKKIYLTSDNPRSENPISIMEMIKSGIPKTHNFVKMIENRSEAIKEAIKELPNGAVLLVLGKGDETQQILKDKTIHFSDKEEILKILETN